MLDGHDDHHQDHDEPRKGNLWPQPEGPHLQDTYAVHQILERLVEFYGNKSFVQVDVFEVIHVAQTVVNGLDSELAARVRLELEDFASDR